MLVCMGHGGRSRQPGSTCRRTGSSCSSDIKEGNAFLLALQGCSHRRTTGIMGKTYAVKKAYTPKRGYKRYAKKKATGRVAKKSSFGGNQKLKAFVDQQIQRAITSGSHNDRQKSTVELRVSDTQIYVNTKKAFLGCFRLSHHGSNTGHDGKQQPSRHSTQAVE